MYKRILCSYDIFIEHQALRSKHVFGSITTEYGRPADVLPVDGAVRLDDEIYRSTVHNGRMEITLELSCEHSISWQKKTVYLRLCTGFICLDYREDDIVACFLLIKISFIEDRAVNGKRCSGHFSKHII